ncbi:hypothetical protein SAMN05216464_11630 [Mucilaginibacter pineti]|uniref:DUF4350 domain-containing protein n=1 Tax=Mucilaginibacter pineti TaxID=1391627 RepID=A0A1G7K850_9SPHI|nr:DUF4350 domain-containing protein [Mucilaginibacter pineti]SDF33352.1 hypothetical protein SAMN05216464_11630 [Mucilaginibacter pineti]
MKDLKIYIIAITALLTLYIIANLNQPKPVNWAETYINNDKIPYGTFIVYNRLKDLFPNAVISPRRQPAYNVLTNDSVKLASYIIICGSIDITKVDYEQLTKHIARGNDVFIAANRFGSLIEKKLHVSTNINFSVKDENIAVKFVNPTLDTTKTYLVDRGAGNYYFSELDTLKATVLGSNAHNKANYIKYRFGKGNLYLLTNPKMFSNYSMLKSQGAAYAATALSYLKPAKQLIWDEYYTRGTGGNESPMRVFLSNPQLSSAYYIALFGLLIFVVYEIKRRQRIIPVLEMPTNSTLDFVTVVGQVYYEKRNNSNIALKKTAYFLEHLRDHYKLKTSRLDDDFTQLLAKKTGIDQLLASNIVSACIVVTAHVHITDQELLKLNYLIEQFYIQSR